MLLQLPLDVRRVVVAYLGAYERLPLRFVCKKVSALDLVSDPGVRLQARKRALVEAAKQGHLALLAWLHARGLSLRTEVYRRAAEGGTLRVVQWLWQRLPGETLPVFKRNAIIGGALQAGQLELLVWIRQQHAFHWNEDMACDAVQSGHLALLQWMRANGCPLGSAACRIAAREGRIEMLQWLRAAGCPWDKSQCYLVSSDERILDWIAAQKQ